MKHAVDGIIHYNDSIVLVERSKEPFGLALPGGKIEENETLEQAIEREIREETNLHIDNVQQFRTYSALERDPRVRTISTVFIADGYGTLLAGSDAKKIHLVQPQLLHTLSASFAFDHYQILRDYMTSCRASPFNTTIGKLSDNERAGPSERSIFDVLYKRDENIELRDGFEARGEEYYAGMKRFNTYQSAQKFAAYNSGNVIQVTNKKEPADAPRAVIAHYFGWYESGGMEGDPIHTYILSEHNLSKVHAAKKGLRLSKNARYLKDIIIGIAR